jgi:NADH:ubiquinone oxidoreductase subunit 2 (subunit N)
MNEDILIPWIWKTNPLLAAITGSLLSSMVGIPIFAGFLAKLFFIRSNDSIWFYRW